MYFEAVFQPSNNSEYNSSATEFVGKKIAIQEGWIPESDLQQIKSVPYTQWRQIHEAIGLGA